MKTFINILLFTISFITNAAQQDAAGVTITKLYTYTQSGGGDVQIIVSSPAPNCGGGFWLSPQDVGGYNSTLSLLLSAYHTKSTLHLVGEDTQIWPGSSSPHCRLVAAGLI